MTSIKILKTSKDLHTWKAENASRYCPLCGRDFRFVESRNITVDHDHKTGMVRGVLCRNCNGIEGKIHNLCVRAGVHVPNAEYLQNLVKYWANSAENPTDVYYPGTTIAPRGKIKPPVKKRRRRK